MRAEKYTRRFNARILIIDDEPEIHKDFKSILNPYTTPSPQLERAEALLFGATTEIKKTKNFMIDSAYQGEEGYKFVKKAKNTGSPYALAFVDMRMPPGWDGLNTIAKIWEIDPDIEIAICTAYSDHSWSQINKILKKSDQFLILKKPFDPIEVLQFAHSLSEKWNLARQARIQLSTLENLIVEKERFVQAKDTNLAETAHDLKNPLNAILGYSQLCEAIIRKESIQNEKLSHYLLQIQKSGKNLLLLLNDLLDLSKMEAGKMKFNFKRMDLRLVFQDVVKEMHPLIEARKITIKLNSLEVNTITQMDTFRLSQVARNLLSNAIKFSSENQSILIRFEEGSSDQVGDWIGASIIDEGIGIPPESIDIIFDRYSQARKEDQNIGTGLGLPICREIIHAHQGKIWAESNPVEGAIFRFFIPRVVIS